MVRPSLSPGNTLRAEGKTRKLDLLTNLDVVTLALMSQHHRSIGTSEFDSDFYCKSYSSRSNRISRDKAYDHYLERVNSSEVYGSAQEFILSHLQDPSLSSYREEIAARFSWSEYLSCNADLASMTPLEAVKHYTTYGIHEPRQTDIHARLLDRRYALSGLYKNEFSPDYPIQVIIHCYHFDVLCRMLSYLRVLARVGAAVKLLVANPAIDARALDDLLSSFYTGYREHSWERVANFGEDWSSFHHAFDHGAFSSPGVTFKLQTKKSANLGSDGGMAWIDEALQPIASSYRSIATVITKLKAGSVKIAASSLCKRTGFGVNSELVSDYVTRLGLNEKSAKSESFCMGSMFAADNGFIQSFYCALGDVDYHVRSDAGSEYCGRYPGHAIERAIFYYADQSMGDKSICWLN